MVNLYNLKFVAEVDIIILSDTVSLAKQQRKLFRGCAKCQSRGVL